jgi:hypothetical protein
MLSLPIRLISLASVLMLMTGCAQLNSGMRGGFLNSYSDPYARSDYEELLTFGDNMAHMSASSRADMCRTLVKRQKGSRDPGVQLHLMVGRLLSDSCGSISKVLRGVDTIPPGYLSDSRLQRFVSINTEALKRMNSGPRRSGSAESRQKKSQTVLESNDSKGSRKDENRLLREKLEAIRSMEKQMDESESVDEN